jgi:four helix bundle protein
MEGSMTVSSYRDLDVWKKGMLLADAVYRLTDGFPKFEVYGISSQLQRAAVSVPANIAEGHALDTTKGFLRHISITRGSLAEVETLLTLAERRGCCLSTTVQEIMQRCDKVSRMLSGLQRSLKRRISHDA